MPLHTAVAGALLLGLSLVPPVFAGSGKGGEPSIASKEVERRIRAQEEAQRLISEGDTLARDGNQCGAADKYHQAAEMLLPGAPATRELRKAAVQRFSISGVACAKELARNGEFAKANARLDQILAPDMAPRDKAALTLQRQLKDPDRYNPALTARHVDDVKKVSNLLMMGEHYTGLGQYGPAEASYNQVLSMDPSNTAARRGLENVEKLIEEYNKAGRDETRLRMLNAVDRVWEGKVPYAGIRPTGAGPFDAIAAGGGTLAAKLRTLIIPHLSFADASLPEVVSYLMRKSVEVDTQSPPESRGVNIVWMPGGGNPSPVTLDLRNVSIWEALRNVCQASGTRFQADGAVVRISIHGGSGLETRNFKVPPGFLSSAATALPGASNADPFAAGAATEEKPKLSRLDPKTFLEQQNIPFPEGSRAIYNAAQNLLTVTNTPDNLEAIAAMVENLMTSGQKQALIEVRLLKCSQTNFQEMGMDLLLETFKIGGGVFGSGGTGGNSEIGGTANSPGTFGNNTFQPITVPFNIVDGPVTAGLRSSFELTRTQTIDDLINISNSGGTTTTQNRSPFQFTLAGLFTSPRFQSLFRGLNQKKGIDLSVATSTIVKSGQKASAFSGRQFFYPTEFDPPQIPQTVVAPRILIFDPLTGLVFVIVLPLATVPVTPATPTSFQQKDIGSAIEVEANIADDNYTVDLNLAMTFTEFDGFINYGTPITSEGVVLTENRIIQPVFSKVSAATQVQVYDGQTVAVGGLTEAKVETIEDKVPILGSIPIIGKFFKSNLQQTTRTAVIYFVTVHIVDPAGENVHHNAAVDKAVEESSVLQDSILLPSGK